MKIRSTSGMLAALLEMVSRAVSPRSTVQLLQAILFEAEDGILTMKATDAEISMTVRAEAAVEEAGCAAIPARLLLQYAKALPEGDVELSASEDEGTATLTSGKSSIDLRCYSPKDFPALPAFPDAADESFEVGAAALAGAIGKVLPFVSKDEKRPVLTGVLVAFADGSVRMVATDSYRMGMAEQRLDGAHEGAGTAILPGRALKEAVRLAGLAGERERIGIALTENGAMFRARGLTLTTRLIEGNFPEYGRLLPDGFTEDFCADRAGLVAALKRVRLVAGNQNPPVPVKLSFSHPEGTLGGGEVYISLQAADGFARAATEVVPAEVPEGKDFEACFNPNYLADAISALSSERVALRFNGPLKPAVLQAPDTAEKNGVGDGARAEAGGEGHLCLIMPMRHPNADKED